MSRLLIAAVLGVAWVGVASAEEPGAPKEATPLFNGKNLDGLTTWLKDS